MPDEPPYTKHHSLAQALIRTFYDALDRRAEAADGLTRDELSEEFSHFNDHFGTMLGLFDMTCRECGSHRPSPDSDDDYLVRLVIAKLEHRHPSRDIMIEGRAFPAFLGPAIKAGFNRLFNGREYALLNRQAHLLLLGAGAMGRGEWATFREMEGREPLQPHLDRVFIEMLCRFRDFHSKRNVFTGELRDTLNSRQFIISDLVFVDLFDALFSDYWKYKDYPEDDLVLDLLFGARSVVTVGEIKELISVFEKYKRVVTAKSKVLSAIRPRRT
ncbi:MAG: hypothetical protein WCK65_12505, partial [Rhodospirillaceae bacterium]